jgi:TonB family protein
MTWAWYLLQVNIYIVIFYAFFVVFLSRETWFTLNRIYLLAAGTLSLVIPFIKPEWILPESANPEIMISAGQLSMLVADADIEAKPGFNWGGMISTVYVCGFVFFAALLIWRLIRLRLLLNANHSGMAFSFFNKKVIDRELPGQETIHQHEDIHIRQYHTADVIYFELLGILLWCNPVIYLYQSSIRNIHEYLADEVAAYSAGDKESYAILLLCKAFNVDQSVLTNSFFSKSLIKKRIFMLNKQRSTKSAILKYGFFLPLFAGMLLLSSAKISSNEEIKDLAEQIPAPVTELFSAVSEAKPATTFSGKPADQDTTKKRRQSKAAKKVVVAPAGKAVTGGDGEKVYDFVSIDRQPGFPGGLDKFYQYIGKSVKYPKEAQDKNVQGKVFLSYIIEKDGRLTDVKVERGLGSGTDEEAVRVLKASPKWIPGMSGNQPVRVKYNVPITFALSNEDSKPNLKKAPVVSPSGSKNEDGAQANIQIKGPNSPLIYVDGVKAASTIMNQIDPETIESITVLKDKAGNIAYGDDAKNGVVLITTKKEKQKSSSSTITEGHPQFRTY